MAEFKYVPLPLDFSFPGPSNGEPLAGWEKRMRAAFDVYLDDYQKRSQAEYERQRREFEAANK